MSYFSNISRQDVGEEKGATENNEDFEVDNSQSVLHKIASLYAEQLMSDLTLEVGGAEYAAHRLILCASSEVFQVMLMGREWSEWRESRVSLRETEPAAAVFPHFLKYFYTGQIKISHDTVLPILSLADKYNVKDLVTLCLSYMCENIAPCARAGRLVSWMQYTMACGHARVAKACLNFVKWNLEWWCGEETDETEEAGDAGAAARRAELEQLEADALLQLLQQSDLVLHNEITLYHFVRRWLAAQRARLGAPLAAPHWAALVAAALDHVRFPMMCPGQLARLLLCPLAQEHKDFFMERMAVAMSYHSGQSAAVAEAARGEGGAAGAGGAGRLWFTPRLYTEDAWGSLLAVEHFHSLPSYHTRTFIFSTRAALADCARRRANEWTLDLYPKGVWFKKSLLIVWAGTYDVPEVVLRTVRIAITCQSCPGPAPAPDPDDPEEPDVRVKIGILVWGVQKGVEHICSVVERVHRFSAQNRVLNIDGALDFDELNTPLYSPAAPRARSPSPAPPAPAPGPGRCPRCGDGCAAPEPKHLLGPNRDQLRIQVVIVPLTEHCHVAPAAADGAPALALA